MKSHKIWARRVFIVSLNCWDKAGDLISISRLLFWTILAILCPTEINKRKWCKFTFLQCKEGSFLHHNISESLLNYYKITTPLKLCDPLLPTFFLLWILGIFRGFLIRLTTARLSPTKSLNWLNFESTRGIVLTLMMMMIGLNSWINWS